MNIAERVTQVAASTRFAVRCLGRFRLDDSFGNQLQIRTRKARAVLAALAVSGRPMSRDALADLLWSDRGPAQARSSLRQVIFELQHFASGETPILIVGRDDLAIDREHLVTDIELVRTAAGNGDWARLLALLEGSEPGLLTDLDGLDSEFDDWLRRERAQEPGKAVAAAVGSAERCLAEAGPRAALDLVSEILRLDPVNEEAMRLALRTDHQLGDSRALHHHFATLSKRLRDDYDAQPSAETVALFLALSKSAPRTRPESGEVADAALSSPPRRRWPPAFVPLVVLLVGAVAIALLVWRNASVSAAANEPILIAVLPFEQQPAGDRFLADGLWDDTRTALSVNHNLRVLGRATTEAMAEAKLAPGAWRKRLGVAYVLDGSVRRSGERVRVAVSLARTSDGVSIWEQAFEGRLGDPIALQEAIASGIEGRLRGRLALGGGRRADQIATSPEVYALYSEARALIRDRGVREGKRSELLLRRAVALDPNFAPAWSSLGAAIYFANWNSDRVAESRAEAMDDVRHALALAPNLAQANATLSLVAGFTPESERALGRAVELDPGDAEAWLWLGNARGQHARLKESAEAYEQAIKIDPLWEPALINLAQTLTELGEHAAVDRLIVRARAAGAEADVIASVINEREITRGDYSAAMNVVMALRSERPDGDLGAARFGAASALLRLGYQEEAVRLCNDRPWIGPVIRSERLPPAEATLPPADFWRSQFEAAYRGRAMVNLGHGRQLVDLYRKRFASAEDYAALAWSSVSLASTAPTLGVALNDAGDRAAAEAVLLAASRHIEGNLANAPDFDMTLWQLSRIRAAQGRRQESLALLTRAIDRGYRPDGFEYALDIAQEPAFRDLRGDPRFEATRKRILAHIAKERAELGPLKV